MMAQGEYLKCRFLGHSAKSTKAQSCESEIWKLLYLFSPESIHADKKLEGINTCEHSKASQGSTIKGPSDPRGGAPQRTHASELGTRHHFQDVSLSERDSRDRSLHILGFGMWKGEGAGKCAAR